MKNLIPLLLLLTLITSACEVYPQDDYEEQYVVESYLFAGRNLQQIRLSTTVPAFEFYSFENAAVSDADVQVRLLDPNSSSIEQVFTYQADTPGIYVPETVHEVLPERTYELFISIPATGNEITARTFVPGDFSVISGLQDTLIYQSTDQLEVTLSESSYPGRQNIFVFTTVALDTAVNNFTPLYQEFYDEEEETLEDYRVTSSGLINEGNFTKNEDGSVTIRYPWLAVAFYGDNLIVASTLDDNLFDYIRSDEVQLGGSTLSPGEIQNVISNVEGGIGIFGSAASDTVATFIKRPFGF